MPPPAKENFTAFTDWYDLAAKRTVSAEFCALRNGRTRQGLGNAGMDSSSASRITADMAEIIVADSVEDQLRALRRERDTLRRENRILKIAVSELERVSERDTLTPLYNRRYFITAIHQRIARFERHDERAAVVYADVNQLKAINDCYGHAGGDFALMEIANRFASSIRANDVAARIGGDEFGFILDQSTEEGARAQVARLAGILTAEPAIFDSRPIGLSACFGVAMLHRDMSEADILAAADRDMYRAKQAKYAVHTHR